MHCTVDQANILKHMCLSCIYEFSRNHVVFKSNNKILPKKKQKKQKIINKTERQKSVDGEAFVSREYVAGAFRIYIYLFSPSF